MGYHAGADIGSEKEQREDQETLFGMHRTKLLFFITIIVALAAIGAVGGSLGGALSHCQADLTRYLNTLGRQSYSISFTSPLIQKRNDRTSR